MIQLLYNSCGAFVEVGLVKFGVICHFSDESNEIFHLFLKMNSGHCMRMNELIPNRPSIPSELQKN